MNQEQLQRMYGSVPKSFEDRIGQTLALARVEQTAQKPARHSLRVALICALVIILLTAVGVAAFSSQVAEWFGQFYGEEMKQELLAGDVAPANEQMRLGDAIYTVDEIAYIDSGLYLVGHILPAEDANVVLLAEDYTPDMAAGYDLFYGEKAPEDAPTYADVARKTGAKLLSVRALAEAVGVDGGDVLTLGSVGYALIPQRDGSVRFLCELPDGLEVEHGSTYAVQLWLSQTQVTPDGVMLCDEPNDTYLGTEWTVEVQPKPMKEGQVK